MSQECLEGMNKLLEMALQVKKIFLRDAELELFLCSTSEIRIYRQEFSVSPFEVPFCIFFHVNFNAIKRLSCILPSDRVAESLMKKKVNGNMLCFFTEKFKGFFSFHVLNSFILRRKTLTDLSTVAYLYQIDF